MTRYIDADALIEQAEELWADKTNVYRSLTSEAEQFLAGQELRGHAELFSLIREAPTANVAPVRHGKWEINKEFGDYECSVCGRGDVIAPYFKRLKMHYCPNCGAKMVLED